jgi:anti-sigma regulatory factor (Ser/Thr protein kinase)
VSDTGRKRSPTHPVIGCPAGQVGTTPLVGPAPLERRVPAKAEYIAPVRREVAAYAEHHGVADPHGVALAVSEAMSNAVQHAYLDDADPGEVHVRAEAAAEDGLVLTVADDGRGMRPRPDSPGMGVGLPLVATLADSVEVDCRPGGGTCVVMVFARDGDGRG